MLDGSLIEEVYVVAVHHHQVVEAVTIRRGTVKSGLSAFVNILQHVLEVLVFHEHILEVHALSNWSILLHSRFHVYFERRVGEKSQWRGDNGKRVENHVLQLRLKGPFVWTKVKPPVTTTQDELHLEERH